jgi:hypothetical protein
MAKTYSQLIDAREDSSPASDRWQLGPLVSGSFLFDTLPTQTIDGPGHAAKIEVHGEYCDSIAKQIVEFLNGETV